MSVIVLNDSVTKVEFYKKTMESIYGNKVFVANKIDQVLSILNFENINLIVLDFHYNNAQRMLDVISVIRNLKNKNFSIIVHGKNLTTLAKKSLYTYYSVDDIIDHSSDISTLIKASQDLLFDKIHIKSVTNDNILNVFV